MINDYRIKGLVLWLATLVLEASKLEKYLSNESITAKNNSCCEFFLFIEIELTSKALR